MLAEHALPENHLLCFAGHSTPQPLPPPEAARAESFQLGIPRTRCARANIM
eukprot:COSAG05_NODE_49_length_24373_cov_16.162561_16_plen_51_part_00